MHYVTTKFIATYTRRKVLFLFLQRPDLIKLLLVIFTLDLFFIVIDPENLLKESDLREKSLKYSCYIRKKKKRG